MVVTVIDQPTPPASSSTHFDQIVDPPLLTRAMVRINGFDYGEWETVSVRLALMEVPANTFRFTCSEQTPWAEEWALLRIRPGDKCQILLDDIVAISGDVLVRQVFYNDTTHAVEIQGWGESGILGKAAARTQTGEFTNITIEQLAATLAKQFNVNVRAVGSLPNLRFPRVSITPGETVQETIEKHARAVGVMLGEDSSGALLLVGSPGGGGEEVVEGRNILEGREIIFAPIPTGKSTGGQAPGSDDANMAETAHGRHYEDEGGGNSDVGFGFLPSQELSEIPAWGIDFLRQRARIEANVNNALQINVGITLLGWQRPHGGLWQPGDTVYVDSPMLIMQRPLELKAVTFTQDNSSGTRATLDLTNRTLGRKAQA